MTNNLYQQTPEYSTKKGEISRIGGLGKANRIIRSYAARKAVEDEFMSFAYKINRSEKQRSERAEKRRKN